MARGSDSFAHEWLALVERSGLLISEPVLHVHFPNGPEAVAGRDYRWQLSSWERFSVAPDETARQTAWFSVVLHELLAWPAARLKKERDLPDKALVVAAEVEQTLAPWAVLMGDDGQMLLGCWRVTVDQGFDRVERRKGVWRTTPTAKLERWLRETNVPFGLLADGQRFRLLHVPPGLPAGWIEWDAALWFDEKSTLDGFATLLSADRFFGAEARRLTALAAESQEKQTELTDALGEQVRNAVERLLLALDAADRSREPRRLTALSEDEIYRAAVYTVMRLVFILFAEERSLLPHGNIFFDEAYGLGRLLHQLEEERRRTPETFQHEADAWPRLLALFRLVFFGGQHPDLGLPPYGGDLFDPHGSCAIEVLEDLRLPNAVVYDILRFLTFGEARIGREKLAHRYSYRNLDVEHIGYLYEGLLDHKAARAGSEPVVKLRNGTEQAYPLTGLEERSADALVEFLAQEGVLGKDRNRIAKALAEPVAGSTDPLRLLSAEVAERCRPYAGVVQTDEVAEPGRLYLTTSFSRRATGTHYTPIQYTRAMVEETLDPLVHRGEDGVLEEPKRVRSPRELLDLKVCDPAMGSGAFLVQVVRYLGDKLVDSWWNERERRDGEDALCLPYAEPAAPREDRIPLPGERAEAENWARRLIAERCIYGVDKNALAVEMAKLSLWLVTLARDKPFSFLDHALKCGDTLIGLANLDQLRTWSLKGTGEEQNLFSALVAERVDRAVHLRTELAALAATSLEEVAEKTRLHERAEVELETLTALASLLFSSVFASEKAREQAEDRTKALAWATHELENPQAILARADRHLAGFVPFHWPLAFPEVFERDRGGFDAFLSNPPYMGGQKLTGALGRPYREHLVEHIAAGARGSADLVAYFFLRAFSLLREGGNFGMLAVNTIAEGDTRQVGLEPLLKKGTIIYSAHPNEPWPNQAAVVTSRVHVHRGPWRGLHHILGEPVPQISAFLSSREEWSPKRLAANANLAFQGSIVLGMGFILSEQEAGAMLDRDPKYADVLFPYLNGKDLNSHPEQKPSRWVINFWDWPEERAREYPEPFTRIERDVKPQRMKLKRKTRRERWWQFAEPATGLYHAVGRGQLFDSHPKEWNQDETRLPFVVAITLVSKTTAFARILNDCVFAHRLAVFATGDYSVLALLQACWHQVWAWKYSSKLKMDLNYSPSDCVETFPFPDGKLLVLERLGEELDSLRQQMMGRERIGLTGLYNRLHDRETHDPDIDRLRELQTQLDKAAGEAYGWGNLDLEHDFHEVPYLPENDRVRFTVSETARVRILERLAALNRERYEEEVAEGLHSKKRGKSRRVKKTPSRLATSAIGQTSSFRPAQAELFQVSTQQDLLADTAEEGTVYGAEPKPADNGETPASQSILEWFETHPGWHARAEVLRDLTLSPAEWNARVRELLAAGRIERKGRKRGTRYRARTAGIEPGMKEKE